MHLLLQQHNVTLKTEKSPIFKLIIVNKINVKE